MLLNYKAILWDFDGVLINSGEVREMGFRKVLSDFPDEQVELFLDFHRKNGGLSRYVKFRFLLEDIRGEKGVEEKVSQLASSFSGIMRELLADPAYLINETVAFVKKYHREIPMHIVSGSDGDELRYLCFKLGLSAFFRTIEGSPTPKNTLVKNILISEKYDRKHVALIGDSINDYEAAVINEIEFLGYNNDLLKNTGTFYIHNLDNY